MSIHINGVPVSVRTLAGCTVVVIGADGRRRWFTAPDDLAACEAITVELSHATQSDR